MKKSKKIVLLIITAVLFLLTVFGLYSFYPVLTMKPAETGRISGTPVFSLKNGVNSSFLFKADNGYILFDAGSNARKFEASLNELGINTDDIKWIFLSHSDYDHVSALTLFPKAVIYMNKDELPLINGTIKRNVLGANTLPSGIDISRITLLHDKQVLYPGGIKTECTAAPGHTPGSMIYLINGRYLFSGDAFKMNSGNFSVHPFSMDSDLSKRTILSISELAHNADIILTSHFGIRIK